MTRLSLVLMLVACLGMSAGVVFAQDSGGTVRGQIVDTTTAQSPIEGVQVKIVAQSGEEFESMTDANGDYERSGVPAGRYLSSVSIEKDTGIDLVNPLQSLMAVTTSCRSR